MKRYAYSTKGVESALETARMMVYDGIEKVYVYAIYNGFYIGRTAPKRGQVYYEVSKYGKVMRKCV